ncbi:MAG: NAD-dependent epimerase/dehydratase family protein [Nevskiaceae bacterium]|nr:MAG: NAD-dependent epimerase/dehydratase family protein [Nevskiaceae bacterium]TBR73560.1 MAG: NAD-dependent epimerase/dehydratase family protein [Nevskiaceae bacterium]
MKALVTGATGFVGSAVARRVLAAGAELRVLTRAASDRRNLDGLAAEIATGDLTDMASLKAACSGCDAVFHVAADYRLWVPQPDEIYRNNVDGTRNLLEAAQAVGVKRVVYTSSVATLGIPKDGTPGNEGTPVRIEDMIGHYKRSKFLAERVADKFAAEGMDIVIVNPSTPIGPRDIKPTPTGRIVRDAAAGRIPAFVDTGLNIVHVEDVAQGHWLAFEHGQAGRRYILGGEDLLLREVLAEIARLVGRKPPKIQLPHAVVMPVAWVSEAIARVFGGRPVATVEEVRMSKKHMFFSSARAQAELGYAPRPARQALADAVAWFTQQQGGRTA